MACIVDIWLGASCCYFAWFGFGYFKFGFGYCLVVGLTVDWLRWLFTCFVSVGVCWVFCVLFPCGVGLFMV